MSGEPWQSVHTGGSLEAAEREWLHTNGAGAYAMSTVALMHTRRYHGLLVAALEPPLSRYVIVSHADTVVTVGKRDYRLAAHQFPGVAPTPGYRLLEAFAQDPVPRWTYRLGGAQLERRLCLVRGRNATVLEYTWQGRHPVRLQLKPLFAMRPMDQVAREHGAMIQRVRLRQGAMEMRPIPELPPVVVGHTGMFMGSPDWWRRFEYTVDRGRGAEHHEDLWTPGTFELELQPGKPEYVLFSLGALPPESPADCMRETCQFLTRLDPGPACLPEVRSLAVAAEQFRADLTPRPVVLAGYPWLDVETRDALIALPGLYLSEGRIGAAVAVLRTLLAVRDGAFLSASIGRPSARSGPCADGSLWLFSVTAELLKALAASGRTAGHATLTEDLEAARAFVRGELYPALTALFEAVVSADRGLLWLTPEGLLGNGGAATTRQPLTWMDSRADGIPVTLRAGLTVEFQALWYRACGVLAELAGAHGEAGLASRADAARQAVQRAFSQQFWCERTRYPYDVLTCNEAGRIETRDPSVRPNAVVALSLAPGLFEHWQASEILQTARERLLTPVGLRTLDPTHPEYRGDFRGPMEQLRFAYHQGTVWVYLLGCFARAAFHHQPGDFELQLELRQSIQGILKSAPVLGQVPQVASGDAPHGLGGCPAQAWSVAELLWVLRTYLDA